MWQYWKKRRIRNRGKRGWISHRGERLYETQGTKSVQHENRDSGLDDEPGDVDRVHTRDGDESSESATVRGVGIETTGREDFLRFRGRRGERKRVRGRRATRGDGVRGRRKGRTLRNVEEEYGTLMFFGHTEKDQPETSEKLIICGDQRE